MLELNRIYNEDCLEGMQRIADKLNVRLEVCRTTEIDKWIAERHYLGNTPAGAKLRLWIVDQHNNKIGAMMWGRPVARNCDQENLLELTRMFVIDETEKNIESKCLSLARKHIRKNLPQIKGLLAYSSTGMHHEGTIYKADNWFLVSVTKGTSWKSKNRENRSDKDISDKYKWMRSP